MRATFKLLIILSFVILSPIKQAQAETKSFQLLQWPPGFNWVNAHEQYRSAKIYNPYLENARHSQHPQYKDEDWYVEDWTSQQDGLTLIKKFYKADIFKNQVVGKDGRAQLVVGPNFYHLSGLDKCRVVTLVDTVYGVTKNNENGTFMLTDWYTKKPIGIYDGNGLRLQ